MSLELTKVLENFSKVKVLVVGDVMLDRYWWGSVTRISPEAPVPVVNLEKESLLAGGAANVAANIKGLGATPYLVGIIGDDEAGKLLKKTVEGLNITSEFLFTVETRPTTLKTRIVAHQQQVARIDQENIYPLSNKEEESLWGIIKLIVHEIDVVIISDYNKGLLSENLLQRLITLTKKENKPILVDPKGKDYQKYRNATILTPNRKEALESSQQAIVVQAGETLLSELELEALIITQGEDGMTIFEKGKAPIHLEALARHVYDVTGAGDTVIGTLAVGLGASTDLVTAAKIANIAAGFVVEEVGTTVITYEKLSQGISI